jgi:catechol 2,3-dioxygenase-like lactoylglutathione lyase family enzyme
VHQADRNRFAVPIRLKPLNKEVLMFSHITIGSNDIARSKKFYDAVIGALGGKPATPDAKGRLMYRHRGGALLITRPLDGKPATGANGGTIGFACENQAEADAVHAAAVANGGVSVEDPPGVRHGAAGDLYLAYMRDPDGNKLCALHRMG